MELKNNIKEEEISSNLNKEEENEEEEEVKKKNSGESSENEDEEDTKGNDNEEYEISSNSTNKKRKRITYITFEDNYDYNSNYFFQEMTQQEEKEITSFIEKFLSENSSNKSDIVNFFSHYPKIVKGNAPKLLHILNTLSEKYPNLSSYKIINDFIISEYYIPKPSICECHFFPDGSNEKKVVNILRTCKKSLDIAIYAFTLESITKALIEVHNRGIPVRVICDNECEKKSTSKIKKLASVGIICKTDNSCYYMHHKFAIIDNSIVITGSFNWSTQAVNKNQENILFLENKYLAQQYTDEFNKLWKNYENNIINKEEALKYIEEKEKIKKEKIEKELKKEKDKIERLKEREMKQKEKEKIAKQKENEKLEKKNLITQKAIEKLEKKKEREIQKMEKMKEKERIKIEKQKEKENQKTQNKNSKKDKIIKNVLKTKIKNELNDEKNEIKEEENKNNL